MNEHAKKAILKKTGTKTLEEADRKLTEIMLKKLACQENLENEFELHLFLKMGYVAAAVLAHEIMTEVKTTAEKAMRSAMLDHRVPNIAASVLCSGESTLLLDDDEPSTARVTLRDAQRIVGGAVQLINIAPGVQMLVNEEGVLRKLPSNPIASKLADQPIVGPIVLLSGNRQWKS